MESFVRTHAHTVVRLREIDDEGAQTRYLLGRHAVAFIAHVAGLEPKLDATTEPGARAEADERLRAGRDERRRSRAKQVRLTMSERAVDAGPIPPSSVRRGTLDARITAGSPLRACSSARSFSAG